MKYRLFYFTVTPLPMADTLQLTKQPQKFCKQVSFGPKNYVMACDKCQHMGSISKRNEIPQRGILEIKLFDVWGVDFMGPFPSSYGNRFMAVDYVFKWVEILACPNADSAVVRRFFKKVIFPRFRVPRVVISDGGSHFINRKFRILLKKYGVKHKVATPYHPQTSGQVKISNYEIKNILQKMIGHTRKDRSLKLDEALWAYRTAYKIPIGMTPFKMVYEKPCHLPVKLGHKTYWAIRDLNFDMKSTEEKKILDLHALEKLHLAAYENVKLYKEKMKLWHDKMILRRTFQVEELVLFFQFPTQTFLGKVKIKVDRIISNSENI
jgi:Integrase core domain